MLFSWLTQPVIGSITCNCNQWLALCALLEPSKEQQSTTWPVPSRQCIGEGWGHQRLVATGIFDSVKPIPASKMPHIITTALRTYRISRFDAIYVGSTALHVLHLFPAFDKRGDADWPKAINFKQDVSEMIRVVQAFTSCPIFQTMHYVCDSLFAGDWARALVNNYGRNRTQLRYICRKRLPHAVQVCEDFSMTSEGSTKVAQIERQGIQTSNNPSIGVVDAFALTYKQCWATNDGRPYLKLLPLCLKSLSERVRACQRVSNTRTTSSTNEKVQKPSGKIWSRSKHKKLFMKSSSASLL